MCWKGVGTVWFQACVDALYAMRSWGACAMSCDTSIFMICGHRHIGNSNRVQFSINAILPHVAFSRCHYLSTLLHFYISKDVQSLVSSFCMRQFGLKVGVSKILAQALYFAQASPGSKFWTSISLNECFEFCSHFS